MTHLVKVPFTDTMDIFIRNFDSVKEEISYEFRNALTGYLIGEKKTSKAIVKGGYISFDDLTLPTKFLNPLAA